MVLLPASIAHTVAFWRRWVVQMIVPFGGSVLLHAALILVGLATYQAVTTTVFDVKPHAGGVSEYITDGIELPSIESGLERLDPNRASMVDDPALQDVAMQDVAIQTALNLGDPLGNATVALGMEAVTGTAPAMIGLGQRTLGAPNRPRGVAGGQTGGSVVFGAGPLGAFQPGPAGSSVVGARASARKVVYVCDASGSMVDKFDLLRAELVKAVRSLKPVHAFNLVFFQEGAAAVADPRGLLMANPANKQRAYAFLDAVVTQGRTDPLPALKAAFAQQPEVIYLLTDGDFPDNAAVLEFIRKHRGERVTIHTIAFVSRGDQYQDVLRTIGAESGGTFRYVSERELGR